MKVLLVEDDHDQLSVRGMLLRANGFHALEASDSAAALTLASAERPECAVVDLRLPTEERGFDLIRDLKRLDAAIHVFVLTGADPGKVGRRAGPGLVDEVVVKGSPSSELIGKLRVVEAEMA